MHAATSNFAADLGVRETNFCFAHFLEVISRYYATALPSCLETLERAARLHEKHTPLITTRGIRIQPPRSVKSRSSLPDTSRRWQIVQRRIKNMLTEMPLPMDGRKIMSQEVWVGELRAAVENAMTEKVLGKYNAEKGCAFGQRTWTCNNCVEEFLAFRGREEGLAAIARMGGTVKGERGGLGWWGVEIPEGEVVRAGGLRFVVDVCGPSLVMFV